MNDVESPSAPPKSQPAYWILQLTGWGLYSLSRFIAGVWAMNLSWVNFGLQLLCVDAVGFGVSHLLRNYVRHQQWRALPVRKRILPMLAAAFVCGIPLGVLTQFTQVSLLQDPNEFLEGVNSALRIQLALPVAIALQIVNWSVLYLVWLALYFSAIALREHRSAQFRQSETARALHLAELRLLKSQLNPHFLFNALNTVRSLIADSPARAQNAVTHLGNILRYTLSSRQDELVTLSQEMQIVEDYLQLESMRFEDRLRIETGIAQEAAGVRIPMMLLQTLVENAIKHGIAELPAGGLLRIIAAVRGDMLELAVENPRPTMPTRVQHESVGLRNARDRLRLLFGERARLDLDLSRPAVARATLSLPLKP